MKTIAYFAAAAIAAMTVAPATAATPVARSASGGNAEIPFVNHGGITDWRAPNDDTLYVQSIGNKWYEAKIAGPCIGLSNALRVGFDTGGTDTFDNFASVIVGGQSCPVTSLTALAGPPPAKLAEPSKTGT